jgi:hypothetical protein
MVFGSLLKLAVDVATLPVAVAADVMTLGGAVMDEDEPYTVQAVKNIVKDVVE